LPRRDVDVNIWTELDQLNPEPCRVSTTDRELGLSIEHSRPGPAAADLPIVVSM
jgi:hypothetical protein